MEIGYILALIFGAIYLTIKIIESVKARNAQIEALKKAEKEADFSNLLVK